MVGLLIMKNLITIGQTAVAYFKSEQEMDDFLDLDSDFRERAKFYGLVEALPEQVVRTFMQLHPSFLAYSRDCNAVLWQGKKHAAEGTESARGALSSMIPQDTNYLVIWNPLEK